MPEGDVAEAIVEAATSDKVDLIVMSSHGYSGFTRWMLGSVAERVLHSAPCPAPIVRETDPLGKVMTILDYAEANNVGLIAMATHGRTGLKHWVYGSVTEKVLRGSKYSMFIFALRSTN